MMSLFNFICTKKCEPRTKGALALCLSLLLLTLAPHVVRAQQTPAKAAEQQSLTNASVASPQVPSGARSKDERYRIGQGDVLDVRVFNKPQFSRDGVRVDARGMIRMPLIEGEIQAACRTEAELADTLTALYKEYLRQPQVDVFIKDYQSQPVAVLGAVRLPSRFQLQRRARLLELLSFAGGPTDLAGRTVQVVHTAAPGMCDAPAGAQNDEADASGAGSVVDNYKLTETLRGDETANPYVRPGDVISIPEAEQAFVVGNVLKPSAIPLKEPITLSRAIAMCGGLQPDTRTERVRIVRQAPGSIAKSELFVDLKAIDKQRAEDVVLQPGDIVDVPTAGGKRLLRSLVGAVVPAVGQLPVRVIP